MHLALAPKILRPNKDTVWNDSVTSPTALLGEAYSLCFHRCRVPKMLGAIPVWGGGIRIQPLGIRTLKLQEKEQSMTNSADRKRPACVLPSMRDQLKLLGKCQEAPIPLPK